MTNKDPRQILAAQITQERLCRKAAAHETQGSKNLSPEDRFKRCLQIPQTELLEFLKKFESSTPQRSSLAPTEIFDLKAPSVAFLNDISITQRS